MGNQDPTVTPVVTLAVAKLFGGKKEKCSHFHDFWFYWQWQKITRDWKEVRRAYKTIDPQFVVPSERALLMAETWISLPSKRRKQGNDDMDNNFDVGAQTWQMLLSLSSDSPLTNVTEKKRQPIKKRSSKWQRGELLDKMQKGGVFASGFCSCDLSSCNFFYKYF